MAREGDRGSPVPRWPWRSDRPSGDLSDPVRDRPGSWEERRQARQEKARGLVDPVPAITLEVVKVVDREAGEQVEAVVQAFDRSSGHNTDGAVNVLSLGVQDCRRRGQEAVERLKEVREDRRYPAQAPRRTRHR